MRGPGSCTPRAGAQPHQQVQKHDHDHGGVRDIAGLVKGASKGEGLGNKFLGNIRECDAIVQVPPLRALAAAPGWRPPCPRLSCCS